MWWSTRVGVAAGVTVGLFTWPHSILWIRGRLMDMYGCDSVCGDSDDMIFWTAMLGAPVAASIIGYVAGWSIARLLHTLVGKRA